MENGLWGENAFLKESNSCTVRQNDVRTKVHTRLLSENEIRRYDVSVVGFKGKLELFNRSFRATKRHPTGQEQRSTVDPYKGCPECPSQGKLCRNDADFTVSKSDSKFSTN